MPLRLAAALRMRPLAWCGMTQRVSSAVQPLSAIASRMIAEKLSVAKRNKRVAVDADPGVARGRSATR